MTGEAQRILTWLREQYLSAGYPNHCVWTFSPAESNRTAFAELRAHGILVTVGTGCAKWRLTDRGLKELLSTGATRAKSPPSRRTAMVESSFSDLVALARDLAARTNHMELGQFSAWSRDLRGLLAKIVVAGTPVPNLAGALDPSQLGAVLQSSEYLATLQSLPERNRIIAERHLRSLADALDSARPTPHVQKRDEMQPDPKQVFIIHGRNLAAKIAVEHFVKSLDLTPLDFDEVAADLGTSFVGEIVRSGMKRAQVIIALFTADEAAFLRSDLIASNDEAEDKQRWQARPNVIFEAGMAYGMAPERTILAVIGSGTKLFSDLKGVHLSFLGNNREARSRLRQKLIGAGGDLNLRKDAWGDPKSAGDFDACVLPEVSTSSPFPT